MHLQGTHSGHNDGTVRGEAAGAALDVHELLQPDVSTKTRLVVGGVWGRQAGGREGQTNRREEAGKHTYSIDACNMVCRLHSSMM
jgi:hypothetical protein